MTEVTLTMPQCFPGKVYQKVCHLPQGAEFEKKTSITFNRYHKLFCCL